MKFGYFANIHDVTRQRDYSEMIDEMRELAAYCDETGFHAFWVPEHHFSVWGREMLGNPLLMAADLAARTSNMRIGLSAAIIPFWHPLRLAEDLSLLDHLTGGRLELGVGRGNYGLEASNLNPAADPNNPAGNLAVFLETLEIIKKAMSQPSFSHKGDHYQFPAPGFKADRAHSVNDPEFTDPASGELVKLAVFPQAKQKPLPPIWQVVSEAIEAIAAAAKADMGVIMWRPSVANLKYRLRVYQEAAMEAGRQVAFGAKTAIVRDTFVAESEAEARRIAGPACMESLNFANWRGPRIYLDPGETLPEAQEADLRKELTYEFVAPRAILFGSPDDVADKLLELHQETNIEQVIIKCSYPGLAHEHTMRSVRLFAEEVMPRLKRRLGGLQAAAE
jgi:alkanesulfonate monooxygenase SsuD/methylene tetrahydromethanopterin reductase-like flavin-dependent oxidoreductase (luciferase family)